MTHSSLQNWVQRLVPHHVPLRRVLVIPFVLQIFTAVGLVGYLSFKNQQQAVNSLVNQLMNQASQRVDDHLESYLQQAIQVTQINLQAIASGDLNIRDQRASERHFWRQSRAFPNFTYVGYSLTDGSETGAGRWIKGMDVVLYANLPGPNNTSDYTTDAVGNQTDRLQTYDYDPRSDQWYRDAVAAGKLSWTRIYVSENTNIEPSQLAKNSLTHPGIDLTSDISAYVALSASAPFYDQAGKLLGVTSVDLLVTQISEFLRQLQISPSAEVFILGQDGLLVASSGSQPIYYRQKDEIQRYVAAESPNPLIRDITQSMQQKFQTLHTLQDKQTFDLQIQGQRHYVQVMPWKDDYGLDWLVVLSVPESDFIAQINASKRTTLLLCLGALFIATLLGLYTSRWIAQPILALNRASKAIAEGNLDQQVAKSWIQELDTVRQSFNHMAGQLKASFLALEQNNADLERRVTERTQELRDKNNQLQTTLVDLHYAQLQMIQSEKMSALGQMVAGVAHEINNPVNFIHGNLAHINTYSQDLLDLVQAFQQHYPSPPAALQAQIEATDLDFLSEDIVKLLHSMQVGTERIREIVLLLRNFSRSDEAAYKAVDLHEGIENTLLLLRHRLQKSSAAIQVVEEYGDLPLVECYAGQMNQVFMNLISNAIDALEESNSDRNDQVNTIWVHTELLPANFVRITIADNGVGISEQAQAKLFNPFFTTKPVGKGTGLGLSISYQIVTERHGGKLHCDSTWGEGTKFIVEIPVRQSLPARLSDS